MNSESILRRWPKMERDLEDSIKGLESLLFSSAQRGGEEPGSAFLTQFDIQTATQTTGTTQAQIVVAHDVSMEADVRSLQKEVQFLKQEIAKMKAMIEGQDTGEPTFELRDVSYEDAKREIKQYFESHHGENIDAADVQEVLRIDIQMAIQICQELEREGQIKAL